MSDEMWCPRCGCCALVWHPWGSIECCTCSSRYASELDLERDMIARAVLEARDAEATR